MELERQDAETKTALMLNLYGQRRVIENLKTGRAFPPIAQAIMK